MVAPPLPVPDAVRGIMVEPPVVEVMCKIAFSGPECCGRATTV